MAYLSNFNLLPINPTKKMTDEEKKADPKPPTFSGGLTPHFYEMYNLQ